MDRQPRVLGGSELLTAQAVPAARPFSDFAWEQVGGDIVLFDAQAMQYHTLNAAAFEIWRACDGSVTVEAVAASVGLPVEVVEVTIAELAEASLLQNTSSTRMQMLSRRRFARLAAAGAAGAVGVPVVLSVTAPSHQAAASGEVQSTSCAGVSLGTPTMLQGGQPGICCYVPDYGGRVWWNTDQACPEAGDPLFGWDCGLGVGGGCP